MHSNAKAHSELDTERLRRRAVWLRQLAEGAAHSLFAEGLRI